MEKPNAWRTYSPEQLGELERINELYKDCLDDGKTERECVKTAVRIAKENGYLDLQEVMKSGSALKAGDKVYAVCMGKSVLLFQIGREPLEKGMNLLGAHIDSPRIDVKQNPLYESDELAYLDTHYYGGIKKYQWVTLPLALHGVVVKKDGTAVDICIGEREDDPIFAVTDLLVHLASKQMEKKANIVIEGEKLDLLVGSRPLEVAGADGADNGNDSQEKETVKKQILQLLAERYGCPRGAPATAASTGA